MSSSRDGTLLAAKATGRRQFARCYHLRMPFRQLARDAPGGNSTRVRAALAALGFVVLFMLLLQVCLMQYGRDQGIYSVVGSAILDGGAPYKDVWDFKPPGIFFTYAVAQAIFGRSMQAVRVLEALALLSMVGAFVVLSGRCVGNRMLGIAAGVLALIYHVGLGFWETAQPESFAGPVLAWALVLATYVPRDETRRSLYREHLAWAGCAALFGVAAILKPPLAGGIVFAFAAVVLRLWRKEPHDLRVGRIVGATLTFVVGAGLVVGTTAAYLVMKGAWPDVHYTFFEYVPHYTRIFFSWESLPTLLLRAFTSWPTTTHVFVWAGVVLAVLPPWRHPGEREAIVLIVGTAAVQIAGIAVQAKFFPYHYGGVLPLTALLAVWGYAKLWTLPGSFASLAIVAALGLHFLSVQRAMWDRSEQRMEALAADGTRRNEINDRLYSIHDVNAGADRRAAEWIAAHTPDHLPIYVWGFEPVIYQQSQRRPASRYVYNVPQRSAWGREAARDTLMRDLLGSPPSVIVTVKEDRLYHVVGNDLDSREELATFPELSHFIQDAYVEAAAAEDLTIFLRADLSDSAERAAAEREGRDRAGRIQPTRRHVLLLTIDTLRPDYLSSRGYDRPTTPAIDELSRDAVVFNRAVTPIPRTTPALASLLTGRYPHGTGVRTLTDRLPPAATTLAELARGNGYRTVAVVSNHLLTPARGLDQGFDEYDFAGDIRSAMKTTEVVKQALGTSRRDDAIFLWVHYIDPHVPYFPLRPTAEAFDPQYDGPYRDHFGDVYGGTGNDAYPKDLPKKQAVFQNSLPPEVNEHIRRLYAADIRDTDDAISELLLWLRSRFGDDWTIAFTADHGESLGEHDYYYDHGDYVYDASARIPLAIALPPGQQASAVPEVNDWVSLIDVAPTMIDILQWDVSSEVASQFDGRSLAPYLKGERLPPRALFAECGRSYFPDMIKGRVRFDVAGRFRAIWSDDWKLIWTPFQTRDRQYQLYHLSEDPQERDNLSAKDPARTEELARELQAWAALGSDAPPQQPLSEEDYKRLKSLGYVE